MTLKEELINLLGKDEIKKVLKKIRILVENDEELTSEWAYAAGRWENINKRFLQKISNQEVYSQDRNSFSMYLLQFIEKVAEKREKVLTRRNSPENLHDQNFFEVYSSLKSPDEIWIDFVRDFKSYNDSWLMEYICPEDYVDAHKRRYNAPNCGSFSFLFFPNHNLDGHSWKPFIRFVKFQALVHFDIEPFQLNAPDFHSILEEKTKHSLPRTLDSITVYLNFKEEPKQTFFRGYKRLGEKGVEKVSIWYLNLNNSQLPHLILKTSNEQFWLDLDKKWNNSRKTSKPMRGTSIFNKFFELPEDIRNHELLID